MSYNGIMTEPTHIVIQFNDKICLIVLSNYIIANLIGSLTDNRKIALIILYLIPRCLNHCLIYLEI